MAHQRITAIKKFGKRVQGESGMMAPSYGPNFPAILNTTRQAVLDHLMGIDPTHGAYFYNMRKPSEIVGDPDRYPGVPSHTVDGPYISTTPYKYIVTYGGPF
jgi:hypothetical protein